MVDKADTLTYTPPLEKILDDHLVFSPGDKFGKRYRIIEEIGRGGMGHVYKAEDQELNITVALKMIRSAYSSNPRFIQHFKEETLLARSISHENVIRIHDLGDVEDIKFISMDYVKGHDLKELIHTSGTLSIQTAINITRQICEGLKAAHRKNIIHLDLKPRNIMIDSEGKVYIMDFGVARSLAAPDEVKEKGIIGTPAYISPEQAKGERVDKRSDIYSLGIILFEMLLGHRPFEADTLDDFVDMHIHKKAPHPLEFMPQIPPFLDEIVTKCLQKDKDKRYQDVAEILEVLQAHKEESQTYMPLIKAKKSRPLLYIAPALLLIALGLYLIFGEKKPIIPATTEGGKIPLVVMFFENHTGDKNLDEWRMGLPYLIISDLQQSSLIKVLSSDSLFSVLENLNLVGEKNYSSEDLNRVTVRGGSNHILYGHYTKADDTYRIDVVLKNIQTAEIIPRRFQGQGESTFFDTADRITLWVKSQLNIGSDELAADSDQNIQDILTDSPEALKLYIQGKQSYYLGDFQESNSILEKAVEIDKDFALAYRQISENHHYLGNIDKAKQFARSALSLKDKVSQRDRFLLEGWALTIMEDSNENAEKIYLEMLQNYPDDEDANIYLGAIYRNMEKWDLAQERFEKIMLTNPIMAIENIVLALKAKGQYKESLDLIQENADKFHTAAQYHLNLGNIYFYQRKYAISLSEIEKAMALEPGLPEATEMMGIFYLIQNEFDLSENYFNDVIASENPISRFYGRFWLFGSRIAQGRYNDCKKSINAAINEAEKNQQKSDKMCFLNQLAYINLRLGRFEEAVDASKQAEILAADLKFRHEKIIALRIRALAYLQWNNIEEAEKTTMVLKDYIENIKIPKFQRYYLHLEGMIALHKNRYPEALGNLTKAASLLSFQHEAIDDHSLYLQSLGLAYYRSKEWDRALEQFNSITELTSGRILYGDIYAKSYYWLGKIYQMRGENQKAVDNYMKFLDLWKDADPGIPEAEDARKQLNVLTMGSKGKN